MSLNTLLAHPGRSQQWAIMGDVLEVVLVLDINCVIYTKGVNMSIFRAYQIT
jgi:hypothetical protein